MLTSDPFYEAITKSTVNLSLSFNLEFYLYTILVSPVMVEEPLAILLYKAIDSPVKDKIKLLKTVGECSSTLIGIFPETLIKKPVKSDYYITIGTIGYNTLSSVMWNVYKDRDLSNIYEEFADNFVICTNVLRSAIGHLSVPNLNETGF